MVRIVEEIAFDAPDFVVHLLPLGARLDPDFHGVEFERAFAGLRRRRGGRNEPGFPLLIEEFFAVERDGGVLDTGDDLFGFAFGEIELREDEARRALRIRCRGKFESEKLTSLAGKQIHVILGRNGKRENALAEVVEIDGDFDRLFVLFFILIFVFTLLLVLTFVTIRVRIRFLVGVLLVLVGLGTVRVFFIRGGVFFVAFWRERRRKILAQNNDVHAARDFLAVGGHVQAADRGAGIGAGGEIEILPVFIEYGVARVAHAVGDLRGFSGVERIDKDGAEMAGQKLGVGNPAIVGRPRGIEALRVVVVSV